MHAPSAEWQYISATSGRRITSELEITVGHQSFSVHIAQMAELSYICADIMSRHSVQQ